MAAEMSAAGPEWAYCVRHLQANKAMKVEFNYMYINIRREGDEPKTIIDSLQKLCEKKEGMYVPSSVVQFDFDELKKLIGPRFDISFRVLEGIEDEIAIPNSQSFRRLLVAIGRLGLPVPADYDEETDPAVLRFFAKPKEPEPIKTASTTRGSDDRHPVRNAPPLTGRGPRLPEAQGPTVRTPTTGPRTRAPESPASTSTTGRRTKIPGLEGAAVSTPPAKIRTVPKDNPLGRQRSQASGHNRRDSRRPSLPSPGQLDVPAEAADFSFLPIPKKPVEELTLERRVKDHDLDYGFSGQDGVHDVKAHNLYADIAGIDRNMRDPENEEHEYKPPYSRFSLPPHQRYFTGWLLHDSARIFHYLGDKMGVGKTFAACEAMLRITMILSNGIAIENERAQLSTLRGEPPLHMHKEASASGFKNDKCRADTVSKFGFQCQCDPASPLYDITQYDHFGRGFMLVLAPINNVSTWFAEVKRFINSTTRLPHNQKQIQILNIHDSKGNLGSVLKDFIYGRREYGGLGTICIVPMTTTVKKTLTELQKEPNGKVLPQQASLIVVDEIHKVRSVDHESIGFVKQLIRLAADPVHVIALSGSAMTTGPSDFKVVESIALDKNFKAWYGEEIYEDYKRRLLTSKAALDEHAKKVKDAGIFARGRKDQIPEEEQAEAHNVMKAYDSRCRTYAVALPLLQRKELDDYLGYRVPKFQPDSDPPEIIRCNSSMNGLQKRVANGYKEYLRLRYQHRVRVHSRKDPATRGPKPKMRDVLFELDARPGPVVGATVSKTSILETSLIGFAPGLAETVLKRTNGSDEFRSAEVNRIFAGTVTASQRNAVMQSRFWPQAEKAFEKLDEETGQLNLHPKLVAICGIIDQMLKDESPHVDKRSRENYGVFPKKAIITVPHAWQGYILIAFLFKTYPDHNFTFVGSGSSREEKDALLAPFKRTTEVKDQADGRRGDPIALISTYDIIGEGLNLTRCNYAIITSPLSTTKHQEQMFGRIDRRGQHCKIHTYVLVDNGNPVDVTTFHRMQLRTALTVPNDERGAGLDFLLENIDEIEDEEVNSEAESDNEDSEEEVVGAAAQPGNLEEE